MEPPKPAQVAGIAGVCVRNWGWMKFSGTRFWRREWDSNSCYGDRVVFCLEMGAMSDRLSLILTDRSDSIEVPASNKKSNHLAQNGLAFRYKPSIAVGTGSRSGALLDP